jgi:hypothetical protein
MLHMCARHRGTTGMGRDRDGHGGERSVAGTEHGGGWQRGCREYDARTPFRCVGTYALA